MNRPEMAGKERLQTTRRVWRLCMAAVFLLKCCSAQFEEEFSPFESPLIPGENYTEKVVAYNHYVCFESCDTYIRSSYACGLCNIDPECFFYDDCCPDVILTGSESKPDSSPYDVTPTCPMLPGSVDSYFMVTSCPRDTADSEAGRKCVSPDKSDWRQELPVSTGDNVPSKMTYRNRYCAQCNGVTSYSTWRLSVDCKNSSIFSDVTSAQDLYSLAVHSGSCNISTTPTHEQFRRSCTPVTQSLISECNVTGSWPYYDQRIERACADYQNVFYGVYRNVFCYLCNSNSLWRICDRRDPGVSSPGSVSLVSVLDLSDEEKVAPPPGNESQALCNDTSLPHPRTCECLPLHCTVGKYATSGGCKSYLTETTNFGYDVNLHITFTTSLQMYPFVSLQYDHLVREVQQKLKDKFYNLSPAEVKVRILSLECTKEDFVLETELGARMFPTRLIPRDQTEEELLAWLSPREFNATNGHFRYSVQRLENKTLSEIGATTFKVSGCSNHVLARANLPVDRDEPVFILPDMREVALGALYVTPSPLLLCRQVELSSEEFLFSNATASLHVIPTNVTLRFPDFEVHGSSARVCEEHFNVSLAGTACPKKNDAHPWTVSGVMSLTCSVISLFFLALTLLVYLLFKELRTASGVCTMSLIAVLFLAQAVFEFGAEQTEIAGLCVALGVLAHYLWLSATFWMNACTVLMFYRLMFPLTARVRLSSRAAVCVWASLYAFLAPAVVVACSMAANYGLHGDLGYGGYICYIREPAMRRFALALPIACLVVCNIALFIWTVVHLRRGCEVASSKDSRIGLFACAKLSVITGLSWLFLFLYEAFRQKAIEYVAIVLFGLHGVVLFLALVLNRHVATLVRTRFLGRKDQSKSSSDVTRLTTTNGPKSVTDVTTANTHL